jgi:hypothetical protein
MRRRWVRRALWGVVVVGLSVVAIFFNHPARPPARQVFEGHRVVDLPGYSSNGTLEKPSKADIAQVEADLDARAHAVLDGDRAAFMGVVDTDRPSFVRGQRTAWENTRRLPFESLSYTYDDVVEPDSPLSVPSFLVRVTTTYRFKGFDTSPIQVDDGFTFVREHGTWKLGALTDADDQFNQKTLPVPWDGGPIETYGDHDYLVVVDRGRLSVARRILALCHEGSRTSTGLLGLGNTRPTVVLATSHVSGFKKFSGPDAEAVTYALTGPGGVTSGWWVVVNPRDVARVVASPVVLPHELTHLATRDYLPYLPTWLTEGSAEYVGWHSQGGLPAAMRARGYTFRRALPDRLPISSSYYLQDIQLNYVQGLALVTWIEEHRGNDAVLSLMRAYTEAGSGNPSYDADTATDSVLRTTLGMTPAALAKAAYAELNATVRSS